MNARRVPLVYLKLAWLSGFIGFLLGVFVDAMWFGRFGSLIVLFALISEYSLLKLELSMLYQKLESDNGSSQCRRTRGNTGRCRAWD